jgi:hypothetical protein
LDRECSSSGRLDVLTWEEVLRLSFSFGVLGVRENARVGDDVEGNARVERLRRGVCEVAAMRR